MQQGLDYLLLEYAECGYNKGDFFTSIVLLYSYTDLFSWFIYGNRSTDQFGWYIIYSISYLDMTNTEKASSNWRNFNCLVTHALPSSIQLLLLAVHELFWRTNYVLLESPLLCCYMQLYYAWQSIYIYFVEFGPVTSVRWLSFSGMLTGFYIRRIYGLGIRIR